MVMDTNEYRSMVGKNDPKLTMTTSPEPAAEPAPAKDKKKKSVRRYITYIVGGEGTLALKQKVTKIGKDAACDIVIKGWKIGNTAATISRTRDGYFFSYVSGFAKAKINGKKASKKEIQTLNNSWNEFRKLNKVKVDSLRIIESKSYGTW